MMYRSLALAALLSAHVSTADAQSVYVAPGGIYVASARVYVRPDPYAAPAYVAPGPAYGPPAYVTPGSAYGAPAYVEPGPAYGGTAYGPTGPVYAAPPVYIERAPVYVARERTFAAPLIYAEQFAPRPPAAVPYDGRDRCVVILGHGRRAYCD